MTRKRVLSRPLHRVSKEQASGLIGDVLELLDCPRALTVWLLFSSGNHRDLLSFFSARAEDYSSVEEFRRAHAASKLLSKSVFLDLGIDKKAVAIEAAEEAEALCALTNKRLIDVRSGVSPSDFHGEFFAANRKIAFILGPLPTSFPDVGWSPGRTTAVKLPKLCHFYKYSARLDVTVVARSRAITLLRDSPLWGASVLNADGPSSVLQSAFNVIEGNVMTTVPKNAKTDRVICYEPHVNIVLQKQIGNHIRSRLRRVGVDLSDQSHNRRRARLGSIDGSLATIDLKQASDTLSTELVFDLLPIEWALELDAVRSKYTKVRETYRKNAKFSSMGNGYTFELESLIFYALATSVSNDVSVYGDDIIVSNDDYARVVQLLNAAGFLVNESKSFHEGLFRESCGGDYFRGFDCTPIYLRSLNTISDVVKLHNRVREWLCRSPNTFQAPKELEVLRKWRHMFTSTLGPTGFGDGHYHVTLDECRPSRASGFFESAGWEGWWFRTYAPVYPDALRDVIENRSYKDSFHSSEWAASLCAALGPMKSDPVRHLNSPVLASLPFLTKRERAEFLNQLACDDALGLVNTLSDRRVMEFKRIRVLATEWPDDPWLS